MPPHPIELVPYDPRWPALFDEEKRRLFEALGALCVAVEHGGSTAVPGLSAKPVLDLFVGVRSLAETPALVRAMVAAGYGYVPQYEETMPTRRYFHRPSYAAHTHHAHVYAIEELYERHELRFRDVLRARPDEARAYEALKRELAARFRDDREGYTRAKGEFVWACLARHPR